MIEILFDELTQNLKESEDNLRVAFKCRHNLWSSTYNFNNAYIDIKESIQYIRDLRKCIEVLS